MLDLSSRSHKEGFHGLDLALLQRPRLPILPGWRRLSIALGRLIATYFRGSLSIMVVDECRSQAQLPQTCLERE